MAWLCHICDREWFSLLLLFFSLLLRSYCIYEFLARASTFFFLSSAFISIWLLFCFSSVTPHLPFTHFDPLIWSTATLFRWQQSPRLCRLQLYYFRCFFSSFCCSLWTFDELAVSFSISTHYSGTQFVNLGLFILLCAFICLFFSTAWHLWAVMYVEWKLGTRTLLLKTNKMKSWFK